MIWQRHQYLNREILYLKSTVIREYDMADAGHGILMAAGALSAAEASSAASLGKHERNVYIGRLQLRRPELTDVLMDGFVKARKDFFEANGVRDEDVLYIKKDAIALISKKARNLSFPNAEFREKARHTSYLYAGGVEFYYSGEGISVKGISKESVRKHSGHLLAGIAEAMSRAERAGHDALCMHLSKWRSEYVSLSLPIENYREFNQASLFRLRLSLPGKVGLFLESASEEVKPRLDISYNYSRYLLQLFEAMI